MKKKEAKKKQQLEKELRKNASITDEATQVKKDWHHSSIYYSRFSNFLCNRWYYYGRN